MYQTTSKGTVPSMKILLHGIRTVIMCTIIIMLTRLTLLRSLNTERGGMFCAGNGLCNTELFSLYTCTLLVF